MKVYYARNENIPEEAVIQTFRMRELDPYNQQSFNWISTCYAGILKS